MTNNADKADRRLFTASESEYDALTTLLEQDLDVTQLKERLNEETPFGKHFSLKE